MTLSTEVDEEKELAKRLINDFNEFEWGVPGKPFEIKGNIPLKKAGGIYIKPSKRGTFTAATKHGMGVQEFASKVLANKEDYSPAMVKKANFAKNASRWKKEYGGTITTQLRKIGCACDWSKQRFTMDEGNNEAVKKVFVDLYNKGLIYKGKRMGLY